MSYGFDHKESMCDKCLEDVGVENLSRVPFLYKDMDDKSHRDEGDGYRQYWVCPLCLEKEKRIISRMKNEF